MKFEQLKKNLKTQIKPVYLITGSDLFLKQKAENLIKQAVVSTNAELNTAIFSTDNLQPDKVIDACNTLPFFANRKLVIVKEYDKKQSDSFVKTLEEYSKQPNDTTCLLLIANDNSKYFNPLKKHVEIVDCNVLSTKLVETFVDAELKKHNKSIEYIAKKFLIDYCNFNLSKINIELLKLISYLGEKESITAQMVKDNVNKTLDFQIYELTNALGEKNSQKAYVILNKLIASKNTTSTLLAIIYKHFRRLFYISVSKGLSNYELAEKLSVKEFAIKKASEQVSAFGARKLKQINELCVDIDYKIKSGKLNAESSLDFFMFSILNI